MGDEDGFEDSGSEGTVFELKAKGGCCNAERVYHACYVILFLSYIAVFPLWAKWIIMAPMPQCFWHEDIPPFPLLPPHQMDTALEDASLPEIAMSPIPHTRYGCNGTCGVDFLGYRTSLMNFNVELVLNMPNLAEVNAHTTYPVLFSSVDFKEWQLVGDRRHASPEPFFRSRTDVTGAAYVHTTDSCMSIASAEHENFTTKGTYILGCVTWRISSSAAIQKLEVLTKDDLGKYCDSVGGVCGWPCVSNIPSSRLPYCSASGIIEDNALERHIPKANLSGKVEVFACTHSMGSACALSTQTMSGWPCHLCEQEVDEDDGEDSEDDPEYDDDDLDSLSGRRRLQEDDESTVKKFHSLPRMQVKLYQPEVPPGTDVHGTPRSFVLAANSIDGPWTRLYTDESMDTKPVGASSEEKAIMREKTNLYGMSLEQRNSISIRSESCFGERGPMYIVACAVNSSIYNDLSAWRDEDPEFQLGQKVAPPPFNDRCMAVSGRCGYACTQDWGEALPYCLPNGYIDQTYLTGGIDMEFNQTPAVYAFVIVLLFGFAVKTLMLCPGIFTPYPHAHDYDPEMTESFKYIVVVSPVAGADENKGTMLRNVIGTVSCMPPDCRCRYHIVVNDEGHRNEMKSCWQLFCNVVAAMPNFGGDSYERNVLEFTKTWCAETKMLTLSQIGGKVKQLDDKVLDRVVGRTTMTKMMTETKWKHFEKAWIAPLEAALEALAQDVRTNYNKFSQSTPYLDNIGDWEPKDLHSIALRMHYTSRAKPVEDARNIMVQHVAVGSWYYKVPRGATTEDWLQLRSRPKEMVYAIHDKDHDTYNVPLRSSHGKAGGLNFVDNYLSLYSRRPICHYNNEQDEAPTLYAIADARHQFQPDFMLSCIPCFFYTDGTLNEKVAFTQAPQHYPEYSDKSDYMDYNNAQFFRLNAMIRNCCGGVSSCGTNGMWLIPHREDDDIWTKRQKRVRDRDGKKREELIEREQFHTSCKIEDTASSLDQVLVGRHSHFVNRKLSFGMAKLPTDFLGAQQRWVEGAVTLSLQWFSNNADAHGQAKRNGWMLWATVIGFSCFLGALVRLVTHRSDRSVFVQYGLISQEAFDSYWDNVREAIRIVLLSGRGKVFGVTKYDYTLFESLVSQFLIWSVTCLFAFLCVLTVTWSCKLFKRCCFCPNEMKWWGRLLISMDNLTYFVWFWTSFFWIGFNYYTALFKMNYHFNNLGMMCFMLAVNVLNWCLLVSNSFRYSVMQSVDANEVAQLSMDNIWRSNQLFFMTGPVQLFSLVRGISEFIKYKFYGQDIGGWSGGDLGAISVNIVKYWTTLILIGTVVVWTCYFWYAKEYQNSFSACVVVTLISLDVLHPCTFLWLSNVKLSQEELNRMSCCQSLTTLRWWQVTVRDFVLNGAFTGFLKYLAPVYFLMLPFLALTNSYFGLTGAYMLVAMGPGH